MSHTQDTSRDRQRLITNLRQLADRYEQQPERLLPTPILDVADTLVMHRHLSNAQAFSAAAALADEHYVRSLPDGTVYLVALEHVGDLARVKTMITRAQARSAAARGEDVRTIVELYPSADVASWTRTAA